MSQKRENAYAVPDQEGKMLAWNRGCHNRAGSWVDKQDPGEVIMGSIKDEPEFSSLRREAEKKLETEPEDLKDLKDLTGASPEMVDSIIHELRVHQIELQMQNDELRRIQAALEKSRDEYFHLFDFSPVGYITASEQGIIQAANLTLTAMLDIERKTLIGMPVSRIIFRDDQDIYYRHWRALLESKAPQSFRVRLAKKENRELYVNLECMFVKGGDGGLDQIRITAGDVTEQKDLENKLRQAQKMEALATIASGIAHQFNNALFVVIGNADLLTEKFPGDETVGKHIKEIQDSAFHMARLAAQLLAYARGGKYQADMIPLGTFVRETLPTLTKVLGSSIHLDTDLSPDLCIVEADPIQLEMALSAVLVNASEAMEGEGRIRVACGRETITAEIAGDFPGLTPGRYACLTVTDTGKGMDEETRKKVFEPFFTTKFQGRGLGLAATYGIVKNHDGWISIDSEPGRGTTIKIYLPVVEAAVKEQAAPEPYTE